MRILTIAASATALFALSLSAQAHQSNHANKLGRCITESSKLIDCGIFQAHATSPGQREQAYAIPSPMPAKAASKRSPARDFECAGDGRGS